MYPYVETIRVENGVVHLLDLHQKRLNDTRLFLNPQAQPWTLTSFVPDNLPAERHKLRLVYDADCVLQTELIPYHPKSIHSIGLVTDNLLTYDKKSVWRQPLQDCLARRGDCDEVLIVKNGQITDTSFTNVAFYDGCHWLTPSQPLLKGVMRSYLLSQKIIREAVVNVSDLANFQYISLFNAMLPWGEMIFPITVVKP